jgi:riboflavin synthase
MFTGLVETTGRVVELAPHPGGHRLTIETAELAPTMHVGDSLALNGCCLTVTSIEGARLGFDLLEETFLLTNLRAVTMGSSINLERAMAANGRYGGHFVTGHIDAMGPIHHWGPVGKDHELRIGITPAQGAYLVPKGCIAVDGMSLTVAEVREDEFSVWIIPHTREVTALRERATGDWVNLEFDLLAKYTEKILAVRAAVSEGQRS